MSDIPSNWITCPLEDLLTTLESGSRPKGGVRGIESGVPSIGGEHITYRGDFDFSSIRYVPKVFAAKMSKGQIRLHDILIVKDGATTGKVALVDEFFPFDNAVINEHVFICRTSNRIEPRFISLFLRSKEGQERILENFKGSAQGGINKTFAPQTLVPLAPLNEQRRIVAKLEKLLDKVEASRIRLEKVPALLKRFRQSVLAAACSGRLTTDWREKLEAREEELEWIHQVHRGSSKATSLEQFFEENESEELPDPWCRTTLGQVLEILTDYHANGSYESLRQHVSILSEPDYAIYVRATNLESKSFVEGVKYVSKTAYDFLSKSKLFGGEIIIGKIGNAGKVYRMPNVEVPCTLGMNLFLLRMKRDISTDFIFYHLKSQRSERAILQQVKGATNRSIDKKSIRGLFINLPPPAEQHVIVRRVEKLFALADRIEARYQKAKTQVDKLTQSILAKAFRGELVPQDPNDEPASKLLERIKSKTKKK